MALNYSRDVIDRVRESNDIVEVISSHLSLRKSGANFVALCPFHQEKSPSFSVNRSKQIFHCFGCGEGGNVISFVMKFENLTFVEALKELAERGGVQLPSASTGPSEDYSRLYDVNREAAAFFHQQLKEASGSSTVREYVKRRSISDEMLEKFGIGYAPDSWDSLLHHLESKRFSPAEIEKGGLAKRSSKGNLIDTFRQRLIFPILDEKGRVVAFGGRSLGDDGKGPKYLNSPESPIYRKGRLLFGLSRSAEFIRKSKRVLIVEGYMDLLALAQGGILEVVATAGTAFTGYHCRLLKRYAEEMIMVFDGDEAGKKAAERSTITAMENDIRPKVVLLPEGKDPDDIIRDGGAESFNKTLAEAKPYLSYIIDLACRKHDISTPEGKADAIRSLIPELSKISDPIVRAGAVEALSSKTKIPVSRIELSLPRMGKEYTKSEKKSSKGEEDIRSAPPLEKIIIRIMLDHPEIIGGLAEKLKPEDFNSAACRGVFGALSDLALKGGVEVGDLAEQAGDGQFSSHIRSLLLEDSLYEEGSWGKNVEDFMKYLERKNRGKHVTRMVEAAKKQSREEYLNREKDLRNLH
ncbi:MAG: DNA primase [Nitrospinota bacterium]|nr:DNA primase [Nitrospinota bacterium]